MAIVGFILGLALLAFFTRLDGPLEALSTGDGAYYLGLAADWQADRYTAEHAIRSGADPLLRPRPIPLLALLAAPFSASTAAAWIPPALGVPLALSMLGLARSFLPLPFAGFAAAAVSVAPVALARGSRGWLDTDSLILIWLILIPFCGLRWLGLSGAKNCRQRTLWLVLFFLCGTLFWWSWDQARDVVIGYVGLSAVMLLLFAGHPERPTRRGLTLAGGAALLGLLLLSEKIYGRIYYVAKLDLGLLNIGQTVSEQFRPSAMDFGWLSAGHIGLLILAMIGCTGLVWRCRWQTLPLLPLTLLGGLLPWLGNRFALLAVPLVGLGLGEVGYRLWQSSGSLSKKPMRRSPVESTGQARTKARPGNSSGYNGGSRKRSSRGKGHSPSKENLEHSPSGEIMNEPERTAQHPHEPPRFSRTVGLPLVVLPILGLAVLSFLYYRAQPLRPPARLSLEPAAGHRALAKQTETNAVIFSWWDQGYGIQLHSKRQTFGDGAHHDSHLSYMMARPLATANPKLAAHWIRYLTERGRRDWDTLASHFQGHPARVMHFLDSVFAAADPNAVIRQAGLDPETWTPALLPSPSSKPVYIFLDQDLARKFLPVFQLGDQLALTHRGAASYRCYGNFRYANRLLRGDPGLELHGIPPEAMRQVMVFPVERVQGFQLNGDPNQHRIEINAAKTAGALMPNALAESMFNRFWLREDAGSTLFVPVDLHSPDYQIWKLKD